MNGRSFDEVGASEALTAESRLFPAALKPCVVSVSEAVPTRLF